MAWRIEIDPRAQKQFAKLGSESSRRILQFLKTRIAILDDPRSIGEALKGATLGGFWKYRVGDYRIISKVRDELLVIVVVEVGRRREVYRG